MATQGSPAGSLKTPPLRPTHPHLLPQLLPQLPLLPGAPTRIMPTRMSLTSSATAVTAILRQCKAAALSEHTTRPYRRAILLHGPALAKPSSRMGMVTTFVAKLHSIPLAPGLALIRGGGPVMVWPRCSPGKLFACPKANGWHLLKAGNVQTSRWALAFAEANTIIQRKYTQMLS